MNAITARRQRVAELAAETVEIGGQVVAAHSLGAIASMVGFCMRTVQNDITHLQLDRPAYVLGLNGEVYPNRRPPRRSEEAAADA